MADTAKVVINLATGLEDADRVTVDLASTTDGDEQAAIDAGEIQATRVDWVRSRR